MSEPDVTQLKMQRVYNVLSIVSLFAVLLSGLAPDLSRIYLVWHIIATIVVIVYAIEVPGKQCETFLRTAQQAFGTRRVSRENKAADEVTCKLLFAENLLIMVLAAYERDMLAMVVVLMLNTIVKMHAVSISQIMSAVLEAVTDADQSCLCVCARKLCVHMVLFSTASFVQCYAMCATSLWKIVILCGTLADIVLHVHVWMRARWLHTVLSGDEFSTDITSPQTHLWYTQLYVRAGMLIGVAAYVFSSCSTSTTSARVCTAFVLLLMLWIIVTTCVVIKGHIQGIMDSSFAKQMLVRRVPLCCTRETRTCNEDDKNVDAEHVCCICLDSNTCDTVTDACDHYVHTDCLLRWVRHNHMTCPMCRHQLVSPRIAQMLVCRVK
jgi:hypothetical protein